MRTFVQKVMGFLAVSALLTVGWSQSLSKAPSPQKPMEINFQSPEGMAPQDWTLIPREPVVFTPFEMLDPNTGKPISADTIIEVNGVKMRAGDYYRQLNEMERWLNERGYSLRKDSHFPHISPTLEAEIAESEAYVQWLAENAPLDGNIYGEDTSDFAPSACYNYSNSWNSQWLGNSLFGLQVGASVNASACLGSNSLNANATGTARLNGRLASYQTTLAEAAGTAAYTAGSSQAQYAYNFSVSVLGRSIWAPSGSGNAPNIFRGYSRSWNYRIAQVNWSSPQIPLFGVSIFGIWIGASGQVGINGALDLAASVNISLFEQQASVNPYGSLSGWAAAWIGVNAGIARVEAGVRGNLTFLSGGVTGTANGGLGVDGRLYYQVNAGLNANLNALSGNLQGYVRGCIWFFGWRCAEASATLFSWGGWSYNGTLVNWQGPRWYL